jgi:hypothetical protein
MAITKPFAINTGSPISGTDQVGNIAIGTTAQEYSLGPGGVTWYMGPDEEPGFVIAEDAGNDEPRFWRSGNKTDQSFLDLINSLSVRLNFSPFTNLTDAKAWLTANGYYYSAVDRNQSIIIPTDDGDGNWIFYVINSTNGTIEFATPPENLARNTWSIDNVDALMKGYGVMFSDGSNKKIWFLDSQGSARGTYSATINNSNYDSNGAYFYYDDKDARKFMIFNGSSVNTINYNVNESVYWEWYWDAYTSNVSYVITISNSSTQQKVTKLYTAGGNSTVISDIDASTYDTYIFYNIASNIISVLTQYNNGSGVTSLQIWNDSGTRLQNIDLSAGNYNNWDLQIYGINSMSYIFFNNGDPNVDWKIYNFEATSDGSSVTVLTHTQSTGGGGISNYQMIGNSYGRPDRVGKSTMAYILYGNSGSWMGPNNNFWAGDYITIVWLYNGMTSIPTADLGGEIAIARYDARVTNTIYIPYVYLTGSYPYKIMSLGASNTPIDTELVADSTTVYDYYTYAFGNSYMTVLWNDPTYTNGDAYMIRPSGATDTVHVGSGFYADTEYNTLYMHDDTHAWYVNNTNDTFNTLGRVYQNSYRMSRNYRGPGVYFTNGAQVLLDTANDPGLEHAYCRILTPSGISSEIQLEPNNGGYDIQTGDNNWMYVLQNVDNGYCEGYLYDFSGNQVAQAHLPAGTSFQNPWAIQDRYGWRTSDNGSTRTWVMLTPAGSVTHEIDLNSTWYIANDFWWWY